jgi:hypothetical protein
MISARLKNIALGFIFKGKHGRHGKSSLRQGYRSGLTAGNKSKLH